VPVLGAPPYPVPGRQRSTSGDSLECCGRHVSFLGEMLAICTLTYNLLGIAQYVKSEEALSEGLSNYRARGYVMTKLPLDIHHWCGTPAQRTGLPVFPTQRSCLLKTLNKLEQNIAELLLIIVEYKLIYYMIIEAKSTSSAATISTLFIGHIRASALLRNITAKY
jgi:hypothetical protein